jgi:hypothetical protein
MIWGHHQMNRTVRYLFPPVLCFILLLTTADCLALRCGDQIVHIGEDMDTVDEKCGRPDVFTVKKIRTSPNQPKINYKGYYTNTSGEQPYLERSDEEWLYNCGSGDFAYTLIFEDNVLARESTQRGYGPNKCISGNEKRERDMKKRQEERILELTKADKEYYKRRCPANSIDLRQLRIQHIAKAQELFPEGTNITIKFEMYRQEYMTDEERKLFPLYTNTRAEFCVPKHLHNIRTFIPIKSHDLLPDKIIAEKKQEPNMTNSESSVWVQCKDKDGNVTLSNVGCPE